MRAIIFVAFYSIAIVLGKSESNKCKGREYGDSSTVCVCDVSYCDRVSPVGVIEKDTVAVYTSSKQGLRLERTQTTWSRPSIIKVAAANITVDFSQQFQKIEGFGAAFTDAAGINIGKLPKKVQDYLLASYFGIGSIEYNLARIPIASCDFSTRNYSYDDVADDFDLKHFSLADEDKDHKIPFIKRAINLSKKPLKFLASPWSAPYWMKTNQMMQGVGSLIGLPGGKYFRLWANYFIKFLDEYAKYGIHMWAVTAQNEPTTGYTDQYRFQVMAFTPESQRDFIKLDLGPELKRSQHKNVTIMILDDRRYLLPKWAEQVLHDKDAAQYVSHIALHWYADTYSPVQILDETHELFPDVSLLGTEACSGVNDAENKPVKLGNWERGEDYGQNIIDTLNHWYTGWMDWNLALDIQGGPNWVENFVDSPIIVNASAGEFYKQPMFYVMGHFSAFLPENSIRIGLKTNFNKTDGKFFVTAFRTPSELNVVIILNKSVKSETFSIAEKSRNSVLQIEIQEKSIKTIIWR